uniref:Uncharacterized protein n=1 Tax=Desertifilum tharense IPPAS B-1220 TaxID=1781255 RepID=A0ACD5GUY2_9CYAN
MYAAVLALRTACKAVVTPVAFWQGSTTGLWTGAILGAFIAGLATAKSEEEASDLKLTPEQRQEAERLLLELLANLDRLENREDTLVQALQRQHQQLPGEKPSLRRIFTSYCWLCKLSQPLQFCDFHQLTLLQHRQSRVRKLLEAS